MSSKEVQLSQVSVNTVKKTLTVLPPLLSMVINDYFVCYAKSVTILFKVKDVSFCYI